uniref:Homeobox domain-containing protein n=1 Tax=Strongyloides papillosus TaxID=174720 RepID=A0A0N5B9R9_STREA
MGSIVINFILQPIISPQRPGTISPFSEEIKMAITINYDTMIKDLCSVILDKIGLGHLKNFSEAFVFCPKTENFVSCYNFSNQMIKIGHVEYRHHQYLTIKIVAKGSVENFSGFEGRNAIYRNLCNLLLKKYSFIADDVENPIIKDIIQRIKDTSITTLSFQTLDYINEAITNELQILEKNRQQLYTPMRTLTTDYSYPGSSAIIESVETSEVETFNVNFATQPMKPVNIPQYINSLSQLQFPSNRSQVNLTVPGSPKTNISSTNSGFSTTNKRVKFRSNTEIPLLEGWFKKTKIPKKNELHEYAEFLNEVSNRSNEDKITYANVRNWFNYRRVKEKRSGTSAP